MTDAQDIRTIRRWVGSTPDDQALLDELAAAAGDPLAAALQILEVRRADMEARAAQLAVPDDYSRTVAQWQIDRLTEKIDRLTQLIAEAAGTVAVSELPVVGVGRMSRRHPGR